MQILREGKGDHSLFVRVVEEKSRVVPIDMGASEMSPACVLRVFRQFGFTDSEIEIIEVAIAIKKGQKLTCPF